MKMRQMSRLRESLNGLLHEDIPAGHERDL
jgi:hypothetical protein